MEHLPRWLEQDFKTAFWAGLSQNVLKEHRRQYDEYLAFTDAEFGRLIDSLRQNRVFDNTVVILTSDHGQAFERGIHGHITEVLYEGVNNPPVMAASLPRFRIA